MNHLSFSRVLTANRFVTYAAILSLSLPGLALAVPAPIPFAAPNAIQSDDARPIPEPSYPCTVIAGCQGYPHHVMIQTSSCARATFPADVEDAIKRKHDQCASVTPPVAPTYSCTCISAPSPVDPRARSLKDGWTE